MQCWYPQTQDSSDDDNEMAQTKMTTKAGARAHTRRMTTRNRAPQQPEDPNDPSDPEDDTSDDIKSLVPSNSNNSGEGGGGGGG